MKLIKIKFYDNWTAIPMVISLSLGTILLSIGLKTNSYLGVVGMLLLLLFVILKIINTCLGNRE